MSLPNQNLGILGLGKHFKVLESTLGLTPAWSLSVRPLLGPRQEWEPKPRAVPRPDCASRGEIPSTWEFWEPQVDPSNHSRLFWCPQAGTGEATQEGATVYAVVSPRTLVGSFPWDPR